MNNVRNLIPQSDYLPSSPQAYKDYKIDFQQAVKTVDYKSLDKAVDVTFLYAKDIATEKELDKLKGLLTFNKGKEDKADKLRSYLVTNYQFSSYRFKWHNNPGLWEPVIPHLNRDDAFKMLQLLDAYCTKQGDIRPQTKRFISKRLYHQQYILANKQNTVSELKQELPGLSYKRIREIKKGVYSFTRQGEIYKIVRMKLYILTGDHKRFTYTKKDKTDPRTYNALSVVSKVYREHEPCFQLKEFDIKSANPQILDHIIGSDIFRNVYANLMKAYDIDRDKAKEKFNATLNNHRLSEKEASEVYLSAGYSASQVRDILKITAKAPGGFYRYMATKETEIINNVIEANFNARYVFRVHDAIYFLPEFTTLHNPETFGVEFSSKTTPLANIPLELYQDANLPVLTGLNVRVGNLREDLYPNGRTILKYDNGFFFFYDRTFRRLNANFNINASIIENGKRKSPTDKDFLHRIDRLYTTLLYLNDNKKTVRRIFEDCIDSILDQPGISFNKDYVIAYIQGKKYDGIDAIDYFKERDYTYQGKPLKESVFQKLYHQAKGDMLKLQDYKVLRKDIRKLITAVENEQPIKLEKTKFKSSNYTNTHALINKIYGLIGIKKQGKIKDYNYVVQKIKTHKESNTILGFLTFCTSQREMAKSLNINRRFLLQVVSIQERKANIISSLENAIENLQEITEVNKLFDQPPEQKTINPAQVSEITKDEIGLKTYSPKDYEYNSSTHKYYLHRWNQESEMVKSAYRSYKHPFLEYVKEKHTGS